LSKLFAFSFFTIGLVFWLYSIVLLHFKIRYPLLDGFHIFREVPGPLSEKIFFYCAEYSVSKNDFVIKSVNRVFVNLRGLTIKIGTDNFMQQLATLVNLYVLDHGTT